MEEHERQLLKSACSGGVTAFEELTAPHQQVVYNFILRECKNEFEACQLTQEVFVRVFEMLTSKAVVENLHAYIYRTAWEVSRQVVHVSKKIS